MRDGESIWDLRVKTRGRLKIAQCHALDTQPNTNTDTDTDTDTKTKNTIQAINGRDVIRL